MSIEENDKVILKLKAENTIFRNLLEKFNICPNCGNEVDFEMCCCGVSKENHDPYVAGHNFVPMGCDCGRIKESSES